MKNTAIPTEDSEQAMLFTWARMQEAAHPELRLMYAIPNGGYRHLKTAINLKRTGVKAGVPDICLPVKRGTYNGLYVEMKRTVGGTVSSYQKWWLAELAKAGHKCVVCKGFDEARAAIMAYLMGDKCLHDGTDMSVAAGLVEEE